MSHGRGRRGALNLWRHVRYNVAQRQRFDYFLILDFEATCERDFQIDPQEIIEFPCLKINAHTMIVESVFHKYIKPRYPITPFCSELTGILQEMVDDQPQFKEVFSDFCEWMNVENVWKDEQKCIFITCGDWDLKTMLPNQCQQCNIPVPDCMKRWINIKKAFAAATGIYPKKDIVDMLTILNLPLQGRLHSGIDDVANIHNIVREIVKNNFILRATSG